jgi:ankyrin repeat protein
LENNPGLAGVKNEQGISALMLAIYYGKIETAKLLANR